MGGFTDLGQNGYKSRTLLAAHPRQPRAGAAGLRCWVRSSARCWAWAWATTTGLAGFFTPLVEFFRPLPQLAYLVLLIVWFGIGETAQVILLFLTALPVSAIAAMDGVRSTSAQRIACRALRWAPTAGRCSGT